MTEQKVKIYYNSDFTARAVKLGDWATKTRGYNFSYPVLNTIDITNLLMDGGQTKISAERMGMSIWSFNVDTSILSITKKGEKQDNKIDDVGELYQAMTDYFNEHKDDLAKKSIHSGKGKATTAKSNSEKQPTTQTKNSSETDKKQKVRGLTEEEFAKMENSILYPVNCKALKMYPQMFNVSEEQCQTLLRRNSITKAVAKRIFFDGSDLDFYSKVYGEDREYDLFNDVEIAYFNALIREFNLQRERSMKGGY